MMEAISRPLHMTEIENRDALRKSLEHYWMFGTLNAMPESKAESEGNRHERRRAAKLERKRVTA